MKKRLSEIHPIFYRTRIKQKRLFRHLADLPKSFASEIVAEREAPARTEMGLGLIETADEMGPTVSIGANGYVLPSPRL